MKERNSGNALIPIIVAVSVVVGIFAGMLISRWGKSSNDINLITKEIRSNSNKITQTLALIDRLYIDPVSTDSIVEALMPDLMSGLDPHSVYIPLEELSKANETLEGEFDGIGVMFNMATDTIIVLNVISNGPSYKAGIQNGDRIIKINDSIVAGRKIPQDSIVKMLRGPRGTTVELGIERHGLTSLSPITVTRGKVPLRSVDATYMITPDIAFTRLSTFARNTHLELVTALDGLRGQGMKKLILDLRGNTGGYLDQAILLANEFLPADKLIVYTEDRYGHRDEQYSNGRGRYQDIELTLLIDEGSASSSEILAGAIQDNDRGTIIGRRSFGKGLVQQQIPFSDGSAVRLTTARYYTPTGRSIQKPYELGGTGYDDDIFNRYIHNEFFSADNIRFDDSLRYETPGGRVVYGGGGIMPDIFVPVDTTDMTKYFYEVSGRNIIYRYTIDYSDRNREKINSITTVAELNAFLDSDKRLLENFVDYAARNGVKANWPQIRKSEKLIRAQLRAYIGRNTPLDEVGYYSNIYPIDGNVTAALRVFDEE